MNSHDFIFNEKLSFEERCRRVYNYQAEKNRVFKTFLSVFGLDQESEIESKEIPLLPIRAFKHQPILCEGKKSRLIFKSSGTSGMERSSHHISDPGIYKHSIETEFYRHFPAEKFALLCHMPGYRQNPDSSLIWMANHLINNDFSGLSCFLDDEDNLQDWVEEVNKQGKTIIIFGAAFGLLDLLEEGVNQFPETTEIVETGGMKTHRREMSKSELRNSLSEGFNIPPKQIHSEYGMCELLSQMYAIESEWFSSPHWVQVSIRNADNPSQICKPGEEGKIGIIDLANLHSCSFILTEDRGVMQPDGTFRVLGRWNSENLRGCNFLIDED
jgi:hypothetical protein